MAITDTPEWQALQAHYETVKDVHLREMFARDGTRGERLALEVDGLVPRLLEEPPDRRDRRPPRGADRRRRSPGPHRRDVPGRQINEHREPRRAPRRASRRLRTSRSWSRAPTSSPRCTRCSPKMRAFSDQVRCGRVDGAHRQAHPQRRQHRDRRLGPRARDGVRGASPLLAARPDVPLRLERRRYRLRRGDPRRRPRGDALHRRLEDVHDPGDDDECPLRPRLGPGDAPGQDRSREALCRGLDADEAKVAGVRDRHREHVRLLGLGRRALLAGVGDRALDHARDRRRATSRRLLDGFHAMDEHFRTAPFERNLPVLLGLLGVWYADFFGAQTIAFCPTTSTWTASPRTSSSSTWRANGKSVDLDGGHGRRTRRGRSLGRARHERPARLLPAHPPGHEAHPGATSSASAAASTRLGDHHDLLMANFFAQTEALAFGKTRRGRGRGSAAYRPAQDVRGQPPDKHDPRRGADAPRRSASSSRCTSTRSSHRGRSGTSTRSTSGASSSASSSPNRSPRRSRAKPSPNSRTTPRRTRSSAGTGESGGSASRPHPTLARRGGGRPRGRRLRGRLPAGPGDARRLAHASGHELLSLHGGVSAYRNGHTNGSPLLAPWANRISQRRFRVAGVDVDLRRLPLHRTRTACRSTAP